MSRDDLWACIELRGLALQAADPGTDADQPLAVLDQGEAGVVIDRDAAAARRGVHPGQRLSQALALCPGLRTARRQPERERALLRHLADIAYDFSSRVHLGEGDVVLEIGGSRKLIGEPDVLVEQLQQRLDSAGLRGRVGIAATVAGARLLAPHGARALSLEATRARVAPIRVEQLPLARRPLEDLMACGVADVEALARLPRDGLLRRFGADTLDYLDRVFGRRDEPLRYYSPPERFEAGRSLAEPVADSQALLFAAQRLLAALRDWLRALDAGCDGLRLQLLDEADRPVTELEVGWRRSSRDSDQFRELLRQRLENLHLKRPVATLILRAQAEIFTPGQSELFGAGETGTGSAEAWLDRLGARLGGERLSMLAEHPDHRPERAWRRRPARADSRAGKGGAGQAPRPAWLLPRPAPVNPETLELVDGAERIESGWWDGDGVRRDYRRARDRDGRELWVYRDLTADPNWYLHGIF